MKPIKEEDNMSNIYTNVEPKENLEISHDCAESYFEGCYFYDKFMKHAESASYIIYSDVDRIMKIHKKTGMKSILADHIEKSDDIIKDGRFVAYADMGYYVRGNDLWYIDIETGDTGFICHIEEKTDDEGKPCEVKDLIVYGSKKLIYKNKGNYMLDLEDASKEPVKITARFGDYDAYFLRGDYLYFVDIDLESEKDDMWCMVKRYNILNGQTFTVSKPFNHHHLLSLNAVMAQGMNENYYYHIAVHYSELNGDMDGYDCCFVDVDQAEGMAEPHNFFIWSNHIYQVENSGTRMIYLNADKSYSVISHDFLSDKKTVLERNYGKSEKITLYERLFCGKGMFQKPYAFMNLGRWVWICREGSDCPKLVYAA